MSRPEASRGTIAERLLLPAPCAGTWWERDGAEGARARGMLPPHPPVQRSLPEALVRARRRPKSSCFCLLVGFWQGICLGMVEQSFLSDSIPVAGKPQTKAGQREMGWCCLTMLFGFEGFTAIAFLQLTGECAGRS